MAEDIEGFGQISNFCWGSYLALELTANSWPNGCVNEQKKCGAETPQISSGEIVIDNQQVTLMVHGKTN